LLSSALSHCIFRHRRAAAGPAVIDLCAKRQDGGACAGDTAPQLSGEIFVEETQTTPQVAQKAPYPVEVTAGTTYFWCACGRSRAQPFCDGSHKGTGLTPVRYTAVTTVKAYFCGCKHSKSMPMCDGSHKSLP
jgi:CDGSH-type Zn-finger protein